MYGLGILNPMATSAMQNMFTLHRPGLGSPLPISMKDRNLIHRNFLISSGTRYNQKNAFQ